MAIRLPPGLASNLRPQICNHANVTGKTGKFFVNGVFLLLDRGGKIFFPHFTLKKRSATNFPAISLVKTAGL